MYHGVRHVKAGLDLAPESLTEAERLTVKIRTLEMILAGIDPDLYPNFHATITAQLEDARNEAETTRNADYLVSLAEELDAKLAPVDESDALNQQIRDKWDKIPEIPF